MYCSHCGECFYPGGINHDHCEECGARIDFDNCDNDEYGRPVAGSTEGSFATGVWICNACGGHDLAATLEIAA